MFVNSNWSYHIVSFMYCHIFTINCNFTTYVSLYTGIYQCIIMKSISTPLLISNMKRIICVHHVCVSLNVNSYIATVLLIDLIITQPIWWWTGFLLALDYGILLGRRITTDYVHYLIHKYVIPSYVCNNHMIIRAHL